MKIFITTMTLAIFAVLAPTAFGDDYEKGAFVAMDINKDGFISRSEFDDTNNENFQRCDENSDEKLDEEERETLLRSVHVL